MRSGRASHRSSACDTIESTCRNRAPRGEMMSGARKWPSLAEALANIEKGTIDDATAALPPFDLDDWEIRGEPHSQSGKPPPAAQAGVAPPMPGRDEPILAGGSAPEAVFQRAITIEIERI